MGRLRRLRASWLLIVCLMVFCAEAYGGDKWSLTIPYKANGKEERIETLKIIVRDAWVYSLIKIPKGWSMEIEDLGYAIEIKGYATHGVAMEYPEFFKDFIVFEVKDLPPEKKYFLDVLVEIGVFLGPNQDATKKLIFKREHLELRRITGVEVR